MATPKNITTLEDAVPAAVAPAPVTADAAVLIKHNEELSGERKLLTIHSESGEGGAAAVFAGLNGVGYHIPRGIAHNVPAELVSNMQNAVQTHYERNDKGEMIPRTSPRFGMTISDAPRVAEAVAA
jgi:hypothetical protein